VSRMPDVVVVGGGVIGMSVARRVAADGLGVLLLERAVCGHEASWAGAGIIAPKSPHRQDTLAQLIDRSIDQYPTFCQALHEESGIDTEYERCGELSLLFHENDMNIGRAAERAVADRTAADGKPLIQVYTSDEIRDGAPQLAPDSLGGVLYRQTAQVRNPRLLEALRVACLRLGVEIREHTVVEDIIRAADIVTGVRTETETIHCGRVVLCAGAWSSSIGPHLEAFLPVFPIRGQIVLLKLDERPFEHVISSGKTYLVPRRDGHVLLGSTEEPEAGFVNRNTAKGVAGLVEKALALVPSLADAPVQATWAGLRPGTPDNKPYIGPVPGFRMLIAATGHYRSGLAMAPVTADTVATMFQKHDYDIDLSDLRPGRT